MVPFEKYQFSVPKDYDEVLRHTYGDYMQLPRKKIVQVIIILRHIEKMNKGDRKIIQHPSDMKVDAWCQDYGINKCSKTHAPGKEDACVIQKLAQVLLDAYNKMACGS